MTNVINKSELIQHISSNCEVISDKKVEEAVKEIFTLLSDSLVANNRVEIRGFGTFCLHHRDARIGRNPKTGEVVDIPAKSIPHFKPGKALREAVNLYDN